jgi:tetratricopeptide (TPR) repeat protein
MSVSDEVVDEIKKETIETHNLIIKTDNLIKNLSSEIRQIQKRQESYEKKYIFNSVIAYILFVILIFAGLYIAFDSKVGAERREKDDLAGKLKVAEGQAEDLQGKISARAQQEKTAEQFLKLRSENRLIEALKAAEGLDYSALSPLMAKLLSGEIEALKIKVGEAAAEEGRNLFQKGELERALRELDRAVGIKPPAGVLAKVQLLRGQIFSRLNRNAQAAEAFLAAAGADPKGAGADQVLFNAAYALENSGDVPRALQVYRQLLNDFPNTPLGTQVRYKVGKLEGTKKTDAGANPAPAPANPPANPTPAPATQPDDGAPPPEE